MQFLSLPILSLLPPLYIALSSLSSSTFFLSTSIHTYLFLSLYLPLCLPSSLPFLVFMHSPLTHHNYQVYIFPSPFLSSYVPLSSLCIDLLITSYIELFTFLQLSTHNFFDCKSIFLSTLQHQSLTLLPLCLLLSSLLLNQPSFTDLIHPSLLSSLPIPIYLSLLLSVNKSFSPISIENIHSHSFLLRPTYSLSRSILFSLFFIYSLSYYQVPQSSSSFSSSPSNSFFLTQTLSISVLNHTYSLSRLILLFIIIPHIFLPFLTVCLLFFLLLNLPPFTDFIPTSLLSSLPIFIHLFLPLSVNKSLSPPSILNSLFLYLSSHTYSLFL
ncbi:unnamed protein product [Acanthosepion pharaonis]|uniref:Uncharacterized protein n=1 Tax=Acanthosepion pharaonis TaxID=158019 RepID=A0A812DFQ7_ACAPH|nr:unnamed protein product [Sepia pharaonis]